MSDDHDRFVTIPYFVQEMLGVTGRGWYYRHQNDPGMPQRLHVGGRAMLSLAACKAYMDAIKGLAPKPAPIKRPVGRPPKVRPPAAA